MADLPAGITQAELDRYALLDRGIKKLQGEHTDLNAKIKAAFTKVGTFSHGAVIVKRSEAVGVDAAAVEAAFPYATAPGYYKPTIDAKALPKEIKDTFPKITQRVSIDVVSE